MIFWSPVIITFFGCANIYKKNMYLSHPLNHHPTNIKRREALDKDARLRLTKIAQLSLGKPSLRMGQQIFRRDCSGTIRAIFAQAKIALGGIIKNKYDNDVKSIYRYINKFGKIIRSQPKPGDLVFFHNTYDRSRNGRMNDALTHVGLVEKVEGSTIHFIHHLGQSIIRSRMDLSYPHQAFHPQTKKRINHILRKAQGRFRAFTAAELFAGFGRL
jgi:peptidoglycan DL-endopeptidase CwlO